MIKEPVLSAYVGVLRPPEPKCSPQASMQAQLLRSEEAVHSLKAELSRLRTLPKTVAEHPVKDCSAAAMDTAAHNMQVRTLLTNLTCLDVQTPSPR